VTREEITMITLVINMIMRRLTGASACEGTGGTAVPREAEASILRRELTLKFAQISRKRRPGHGRTLQLVAC
jgi:hypothetical protein